MQWFLISRLNLGKVSCYYFISVAQVCVSLLAKFIKTLTKSGHTTFYYDFSFKIEFPLLQCFTSNRKKTKKKKKSLHVAWPKNHTIEPKYPPCLPNHVPWLVLFTILKVFLSHKIIDSSSQSVHIVLFWLWLYFI